MKKKLCSILLCLTTLCALLAGCGKDSAEPAPGGKAVSVILNEVAHSIFYAPMYVAIEEGYFADEGIDLDLVTGFGVIQLV